MRNAVFFRIGAALAATAMSVVVGGAALSPDASAKSAAVTAAAHKNGGTVSFGEATPITSLDPTKITGFGGTGGTEGAAVYGELMRLNTATNTYVPSMAKSLAHNATYTTWTLTLRPGVAFSDGSPYNAAAVVENIDRDMNPALHATASAFLDGFVQSATAATPLTVVFALKSRWTSFPYLLAEVPGLIAAPSYLAELTAGNANATPIGAGPFMVTSFRPSEELTMMDNPNYFAGRPHLNSLKFVYIPGGPATLQAFNSGELQAAALYDPVSVQQATQQHAPRVSTFVALNNVILLNGRAGNPLSNPLLREAIAMGVNTKLYHERVDQGAGVLTNQIFPPGSPNYSPSMLGVPYNPKMAKKLVAEVKQKTGWNGTLNFECAASPSETAIPVALESMLTPLGINLNVAAGVTPTQFIIDVVVEHNFDMACWGDTVIANDPFPGLWGPYSADSPNNFSGFSSATYAAALATLQAASTPAAKKSALAGVVKAWNATWPSINLGGNQVLDIHSAGLHGVYDTLGAVVLFDQAWMS